MTQIRMAQYGTKHSHGKGKVISMLNNPNVELIGVWEPDPAQRQQLTEQDDVYQQVTWFEHEDDLLNDPSIVAVASEGNNKESLDQTERIVSAGKHVWYDKPAGEDWTQWQRIVAQAKEQNLLIQMGYMLRYHDGFHQIANWTHSGFLGDIFSVRGHMSTGITPVQMERGSQYQGGILYDLGGHMLDQVLWLLGRPHTVTSFLRNDSGRMPGYVDNSLAVFEFDNAMAMIDIAALETKPMARRFEVYGTKGSAILIEPFEPGTQIRLCLNEARGGFDAGVQFVPIDARSRQGLYDLELEALIATINGAQAPDRSLDHELLVQEMLLRAVGTIE
ncbi:MAG: Gfo/Idh/MocA family oxidoreductase [Chloroflexota bacterium]